MNSDEFTNQWIELGEEEGVILAENSIPVMVTTEDGTMHIVKEVELIPDGDPPGGHTVWIRTVEY